MLKCRVRHGTDLPIVQGDATIQVVPTNIIDISAITSIFRPGPLSANVDKDFVKTRKSPGMVRYINDTHREVTEETNGFLIFQEQIAVTWPGQRIRRKNLSHQHT